MSFRVKKDLQPNYLRVTEQSVLPFISSTAPPPNLLPGTGGGIAYDTATNQVYYNNGFAWLPIASGAAGAVFTYSLTLDNNIPVPTSASPVFATPTQLNDFQAISPHHDLTGGWNLVTGVYTAATSQTFNISANVTWEEGTNLGFRTIEVMYKPNAGVPVSVNTVKSQANPSSSIPTTQFASATLAMGVGDTVWVQVSHTASSTVSPLTILAGEANTLISGARYNL